MLPDDPQAAPASVSDPVERAWFAAAGSLEDRVERTLNAALELGRPNLEGPGRALLLEESLGTPLQRAEAAVRLAPDLPAARIALGQALWSENWDLVGALDQLRQAAQDSARHLEASIWLRATILHALVTACLIGGLLFLFVAGGSLVAATARVLAELPGSMPLASRAALLAGLLLIPAVLGEGLFGLALAFAALGFWRGSSWQRVALGTALVISIAGLCIPWRIDQGRNWWPWARIRSAKRSSPSSTDGPPGRTSIGSSAPQVEIPWWPAPSPSTPNEAET
jgi:hypothetical protein